MIFTNLKKKEIASNDNLLFFILTTVKGKSAMSLESGKLTFYLPLPFSSYPLALTL